MNIVFYIFLILTAVYSVLNYKSCGEWYWNIIQTVPKKIWDLVKSIFKK